DGTPRADGPRRNVLSRFTVEPGRPDVADPDSELVILEVLPQDQGHFHNGGQVAFGPDGYLYFAIGDTGDRASSQDLGNLHGSIVRIDVADATPEASYAIPPDNPFVDVPGVRS